MRASRGLYVAFAITIVAAMPRVSFAHPMGNFSINHYTKIEAGERVIDIEYIIDMAEIPTFQEILQSGFVPKKDDPGVVTYLGRQSESLKTGLTLQIDGRRLRLDTASRDVIFPPGAGGLPTMKMGFLYRATLQPPIAASLSSLSYVDGNFPGRAGWKEVIAVAGSGATLVNSSAPSRDRSFELSNYPTDLLHSPPQSLVADLTFKALPPGTPHRLFITSSPDGVKLVANQRATPRSAFTELISSNRTDLTFLLMALLIAAILGGFHAFEPGHGKTLVAAYLVGSRGTARHAVLLGSVVTASHTISVYVIGIVTLYASQLIVPERLYPWLGTASGLLVGSLGFTLFIRRFVSDDSRSHGAHSHGHSHHNSALVHHHTLWGEHVDDHSSLAHAHDQDRDDHEHSYDSHSHDHNDSAGSHSHEKEPAAESISLRNLFVLGITGGIVPCPAALVVLLGALAIHRVAFGLFLIVAFSVGLAAVLVSFGLAMVYARRFMSRFQSRGPLTERWLPLASSAVITLIGVTITIQSLVTAGVLRIGT